MTMNRGKVVVAFMRAVEEKVQPREALSWTTGGSSLLELWRPRPIYLVPGSADASAAATLLLYP
jgi:hypothetical protein